ncbi:MAG: efflux RND transporter permease subunit [Holophagales bacterium]|nr:efflux RND transporter permease subunit [Holophagales bacterium]MYD22445.1 efflux RND transporter permease subunit [Holophagales bacterium]MYI32959.1 efflux RND transporter permease subunit [Holophagales bacterium]
MRVVSFATRRPVTVFIFALAAVVFGGVAFRDLAVDLLPDITYPSLTVQTGYEGAAPVEMETLITRPVEDAVGVVNGVNRVVSSSRADISEVTLEFSWGTNMDFASLDVRERLDQVRLPVQADRPVLLRYDPSLDPILRMGLAGGGSDLIALRLLAEEDLKRKLERLEGVAAVVVSGGLEEEIQVEIDERRLSSLGLTMNQVMTRLAQENVNLTGGRLRDGQTDYLVRTINELLRPEEMREIVIDRSQGAIVRLEDIARVYQGAREREVITRIDGREAVEIAVYKEGGTNTVTVASAVLERVEELEEEIRQIDPQLELTVLTDQSRYIRDSVSAVIETALIGGSLAIVVLFLFLRSAPKTLIIGISIPVSVVATFFLMYVAGVSLNIMSLGGITLGIGLLLDNSIVVLEAIQRRRDQGLSVVEAARAGASEVGRAVIASTITTVCVFVPIVFVEGVAGQMFGDQALTVTFSLLVSLGVALTVIPMLASRKFFAAGEPVEKVRHVGRSNPVTRALSAFFDAIGVGVALVVKHVFRAVSTVMSFLLRPVLAAFDALLRGITAVYARVLRGALRHPALVVLAAVVLLAGSVQLIGSLGSELVPELIQGEFYVDAELAPGSRLEVTDRRLGAVARFVREQLEEEVQSVYMVVGTSNEQGGAAGERRENIGQVNVRLNPPVDVEREEAVMSRIRNWIDENNSSFAGQTPPVAGTALVPPGAGFVSGSVVADDSLKYRFGRPTYFSFRSPVEVQIRGHNLALLERLADQVASRMRGVEGLVDVKSSTEGGNPELQIIFDRERLSTLNYTVAQLGAVIRSKVQGDIATDIVREDRNIEVRLRTDEGYRDSVRDLRNLNIRQSGATPLPLSAVADVIETEGPAEIRRSDGGRVALIEANIVGRDLGSVSDDIEGILESTQFPVGFDYSIGGQRQEMERSFDSMRLAILLAVFMVYLVMASQFESLLHPFVILFAVPFSIIGAIGILYLTRTPVSIVVLIGGILLAGIVVNNAIILIDYTNRLRRAGKAKVEALREACLVRLRPILMTTSTTVLGLLPMALGVGEGAELRTPMALTVVGGLLTSTLLTLIVIPALYLLLDFHKRDVDPEAVAEAAAT